MLQVRDPDALGSARIISANPAALRMQALAPQDAIGKTIAEVFPELLETTYPERAARVLHTGSASDLGFLRGFRHPWRTYAVKVFPLPKSCVGVMFEDVSHVRALAEAQDRFAKALRVSPLAMCIMTLAEGKLLDANPRFLELFGFKRRDDLGSRRAGDLGIWKGAAEHKGIAAELRKHGEIREAPMACRTADGRSFQALAALELIKMEGDDCVLAMFWRS